MIRSSLMIAAALFATPLVARAADYEIDNAHSEAQFKIKHMMVSNVRGEFKKFSGTISYDPANVAATKIEATLDASTIDTGNEQRDGHLKSPDFFDVAKFPTLTFKSTKVEKGAAGHLKVTGDLTMHGITKPVVLDVEGPTGEGKDPYGNVKTGATATGKLNRKDFGLTWNKGLETGGVLVGEDVEITLDLELTKKAPAAAAPAAPAAPAKKK